MRDYPPFNIKDPEGDINWIFRRQELRERRARSEARRAKWQARWDDAIHFFRWCRLMILEAGRKDRAVAVVDTLFGIFLAAVVLLIVGGFVWG